MAVLAATNLPPNCHILTVSDPLIDKRVWILAMRFGKTACLGDFPNQSLDHKYFGTVKSCRTASDGTQLVSVLWDNDVTAIQSGRKEVYPYDGDVVVPADEEAAVAAYESELAASRQRKPKAKSKKGKRSEGSSSGTGANKGAKKAKKDKKVPSLTAFKLPNVDWKPVTEFKSDLDTHEGDAKFCRPNFGTGRVEARAMSEMDYIMHALPNFWKDAVPIMNRHKRMEGRAKVTIAELKKWFGCILAMCCQPRATKEDYWKTVTEIDDLFPAADLGRFGMSQDRWERLWSALEFDQYGGDPNDKWACVRMFIDEWNDNSANMLDPGFLLCLDESMSRFLSRLKGDDEMKAAPHLSYVQRKPEPNGHEMKTTACCTTGCIIRVEVQEGKAANKRSDAAGVDGYTYQHHIGVSLRLVEPWWGTGRTVIGDSWFASLSCATAMAAHGLASVLNVKTATRGFCKAELLKATGPKHGAIAFMETEVDLDPEQEGEGGKTTKIWGTAMREGRKMVRMLATTAGSSKLVVSTDAIEDQDGYRELIDTDVPLPTATYRAGAPSIDVHNHLRQGILALEHVIIPRAGTASALPSWAKRIVSTLFAMSIVNAYLMHKKWGVEKEDRHPNLMAFVHKAAYQFLSSGTVSPHEFRSSTTAAGARGSSKPGKVQHYTRTTSDLGMYKMTSECPGEGKFRATNRAAQFQCMICKKPATTICMGCGPKKGCHAGVCLRQHQQDKLEACTY